MPPRHGDAPVSHGARLVLSGHVLERTACLLVAERVQECDASCERRTDVRRARRLEVNGAERVAVMRVILPSPDTCPSHRQRDYEPEPPRHVTRHWWSSADEKSAR